MKTFKQKKEELKALEDRLQKAKITIFTSFARAGEKGMSVGSMRELKKALYGIDSEYVVEKKTLLNKALKDAKKDIDVSQFQGSLGTVFGYADEITTAKSLYGFARKFPSLKYFGAIMGTQIMDEAQLTAFAKLPSREVLLAQLVGMLSHPMRSLAVVIDQIGKSR